MQRIVTRLGLLIFAVSTLAACSTTPRSAPMTSWEATETGEIRGKLVVQWIAPDTFLYEPDAEDPFTFVRKRDGEVIDVIVPQRMITDGGSVPRAFWINQDFSPWRYGPAYMIHDWLFEMHDCGLPGSEKYDDKVAAQIMAEVMKTQITQLDEEGTYPLSDLAVIGSWQQIFAAVYSFSAQVWDSGTCDFPVVQ